MKMFHVGVLFIILLSATVTILELWMDVGPSKIVLDLYSSNKESPAKAFAEFIRNQLAASEEVYQLYRSRRRAFVGDDPTKVNPWPTDRVLYFWDYFLPTFSCPYTIQRIGSFGDGGKWVCGFELYEKEDPQGRPCIVYSFGVSVESSFEAEIVGRTKCMIYAFDASVSMMGPQVDSRSQQIRFSKRYIQSSGNDTLSSIMKENGHKWIDILKMDVEGAEFDVFSQIVDDFEILPFSQLQIEMHADPNGPNSSFPKVYKLWERLEEKGLRPFKNEVNHWPCVRARMNPIYLEYGFINIKAPSRLVPL